MLSCMFHACRRSTGLTYAEKGLRSAPNATRRSISISRGRRDAVANLGAEVDARELAQKACNKNNLADPQCVDTLLLALTPAAYSSNNRAPGGRAFISPAQVRLTGQHCVACTVLIWYANPRYTRVAPNSLQCNESCTTTLDSALQWYTHMRCVSCMNMRC
jgi:hypothetical protein